MSPIPRAAVLMSQTLGQAMSWAVPLSSSPSSRALIIAMEVPLKPWYRHAPPSPDLDGGAELASATKAVKSLGMKPETSGSLWY
jgi:hypothetical protein